MSPVIVFNFGIYFCMFIKKKMPLKFSYHFLVIKNLDPCSRSMESLPQKVFKTMFSFVIFVLAEVSGHQDNMSL